MIGRSRPGGGPAISDGSVAGTRQHPEHRSPSIFPFAFGRARVLGLEGVRSLQQWQQAFKDQTKDHRFYEIVEETLHSKFEHHYLVLEDTSGKIRGIQPLFFVQQNLIEGIPSLRPAVEAIRKSFPRFLTMRVLMVGNVAGEGHLSACNKNDEEWVADALFLALKAYGKVSNASLIVFKDFPAKYRHVLRSFSAHGYTRVPSMPMTELQLRYDNFDHYLSTLGASTRKDLRRKFRRTAAATPISLEIVTDLTPYVDELYPLYLQVHERSSLKFERLTKEYLIGLGQRMPDRARFFVWRQNGSAIAFSVAMIHGDTIHDDYLGLDYTVALDLHLYFYTFRDILSWSLEQGLKGYQSSPLNYHPKLHLGCDLSPLDLYVTHTTAWLNPIIRQALKFLEPTRYDPVLSRFRNAQQLHSDAK